MSIVRVPSPKHILDIGIVRRTIPVEAVHPRGVGKMQAFNEIGLAYVAAIGLLTLMASLVA